MPDHAEDEVVAAAAAGDRDAFTALVRRHERELHVHCYRMLGSFADAEDLVQETFLRAWRRRDTFEGNGFRAWLYRIATNACLDELRRSSRVVSSIDSYAEIPWLQPYPDRLLNEIAPSDDEPDAMVVAKETIELAFLAAIQLLPARQRAALVLRDVLGWTAQETADALEMSVASANSALQRARTTLRERLPQRRLDWTASEPSAEERELLLRFIDTHERGDARAAVTLLRDDIRVTMPPLPMCFQGIEQVAGLISTAFSDDMLGRWRLVPTSANRQPAAASYYAPPGEDTYKAFKLDVLRIEDGKIAEITTFDPRLFAAFGLPETLEVG
jgi:RNA polymerase sigma-70 factor (ECF subfamily)